MVESMLLKKEAQKENWASLTNISLLLLPSHQFIPSFSEKDSRNPQAYNKFCPYLQGTENSRMLFRAHYNLAHGNTMGYWRLWTIKYFAFFSEPRDWILKWTPKWMVWGSLGKKITSDGAFVFQTYLF